MSEKKKAYRAKPAAKSRVDKPGKISDDVITQMVRDLENIHMSAQRALCSYHLALTYGDDDAQLNRLHLFDRAARRSVMAKRAFDRAYERQPEDFMRIIQAEALKA